MADKVVKVVDRNGI